MSGLQTMPDLPGPMPALVNLPELHSRLRSELMALLTGGEAARMRHMVVVERLCALARDGMPGDEDAAELLGRIAQRAPILAGLMQVPEGLRERAFADCVRLLGALRPRMGEGA